MTWLNLKGKIYYRVPTEFLIDGFNPAEACT
jgi:hypothetical protein